MILHNRHLRQIESTVLSRLQQRSGDEHRVHAQVVEIGAMDRDAHLLITVFRGSVPIGEYRIPGDLIGGIASPALFDALVNVWFNGVGYQAVSGLS